MGLDEVVIGAQGKIYPNAELAKLVAPELNHFRPDILDVDPFNPGYDGSVLNDLEVETEGNRVGKLSYGSFVGQVGTARELASIDLIFQYWRDRGYSLSDFITGLGRGEILETELQIQISSGTISISPGTILGLSGNSPKKMVQKWFANHPNEIIRAAYSKIPDSLYPGSGQLIWQGENSIYHARERTRALFYTLSHNSPDDLEVIGTRLSKEDYITTPILWILPDGKLVEKTARKALAVYNNSPSQATLDCFQNVFSHERPTTQLLRVHHWKKAPNGSMAGTIGKIRMLEVLDEAARSRAYSDGTHYLQAFLNLQPSDFENIQPLPGKSSLEYSGRRSLEKLFPACETGLPAVKALKQYNFFVNELLSKFFEVAFQFPKDRQLLFEVFQLLEPKKDPYEMFALFLDSPAAYGISGLDRFQYVSPKNISLIPGKDFMYIRDSDQPHPDSLYVRSRGDVTDKDSVLVNRSDISRTYLGLSYRDHGISAWELFHSNTKNRDLELKLSLAPLDSLLHNDSLYYPPGTREILELDANEIRICGEITRNLMKRGGQLFVSKPEALSLSPNLLAVPTDRSTVATIDFEGTTKYNLFQLVHGSSMHH